VKGDRSTYRIRLKYVDPKTGRSRDLERLVEATSPADAARQREDLRTAPVAEATRLDVEAYAASWLAGKRRTVAAATLRTYAERLDHFAAALGDVFLDQVSKADIIAWRDAQHDAPDTINGRLRMVRALFREAHADGLIGRDPARRVQSVATRQRARSRCLSAAELHALLEATRLERPRWYPLTLFLATTGMRWGEATALRWSDIDLDAGTVHIRRAHNKGRIGPPKTQASRRLLPLSEELVEVLREQRREHARSGSWSAAAWVFPSRVGTLMQPSSIRKPLAAAAATAGLDARPSAHWFRYTFNRLLRQTAEGIVQRSMTGHVTEAMADHYDHVALDEKRSALGGVVHRITTAGVDSGVDEGVGGSEPGGDEGR